MWNAQTYFIISTISYPFISLYNAGAALFRSMGNSKISMHNSIMMNILLNIFGNVLLIYIFKLGVLGAGLATLFSRMVGAILVLLRLRNPKLAIYVQDYKAFKFNFPLIKTILQIGIPNGLENGMFQIGKILVIGVVSSFGTTAIAANAVANNIAGMEVIPGAAIGLAMITVVGVCVGANDYKQAEHYIKYLMKLTYIFIFVVNIFIIIFDKQILSLYNLSTETMQMAHHLIILHGIFTILIWSLAFTLPNAFRAANDAKFTMTVFILSMWIFRISACFILAYHFNMKLYGVWFTMFLDWTFRAIYFVYRYFSEQWKK